MLDFLYDGGVMELRERLDYFGELMLNCSNLYLWTYDKNMVLIQSNCPHAAAVSGFLALSTIAERLPEYGVAHHHPIIMTNRIGSMWIAIPGWENGVFQYIYALGPFYNEALSREEINQKLEDFDLSLPLKRNAVEFLSSLPVVSINHAFEYGMMLYYSIYSEKIEISDFHYSELESASLNPDFKNNRRPKIHGTYEMEQEMVRMVREGNLNYRKTMNQIAIAGTMGQLSLNGDSQRQFKNAVLVCTVLFSRAAIEGGLSPEIALTLTDYYFQNVESCHGISELSEIAHTMQEDFVTRVHRCRMSKLSKPIQDCCDYIDLHIEEPLTLEQLASHLGYSNVYLCKKFKEDTGQTFKEYIRCRKMEKAREMMRASNMTIKDISEALGFCSLSYFGKSFREVYGISPSEYRNSRSEV